MSCNHTPQPPKPNHPDWVQHQAIAIVVSISLLVAFLALQESQSSYQKHHTNVTKRDRIFQLSSFNGVSQ